MSNMSSGANGEGEARVELHILQERRLIPRGASARHVALRVKAIGAPAEAARVERAPLALALVLDRSGSMSGEKIETAKRAALAVLERLDERDTAAVVAFDDRIETVHPAARMTREAKRAIRAALGFVGARGSTALHEGWLTGCHAIAEELAQDGRLPRCFLLTDGLANVGTTDPEQIATQAAEIRERTGIATSTFGIGDDYAEELLGPMAEAGGGKFYHLRAAAEIATTLVGELGEMLATATANVRIELEAEPGTSVEPVSTFWAKADPTNPARWTLTIGGLVEGEERAAVLRLGFADSPGREERAVRARALWNARGAERSADWQTVRFIYASDAECEAETPNEEVLHLVARHLSDRSQREALRASKAGDHALAMGTLSATKGLLASFGPPDAVTGAEVSDIDDLEHKLSTGQVRPAYSKEVYFQKQRRSSGYRDLRQSSSPPPSQPASDKTE